MTKPFSKYQVQYENPAKDPKKHCSICKHYIKGNTQLGTCEIVRGIIDPEAWCKKFKKE